MWTLGALAVFVSSLLFDFFAAGWTVAVNRFRISQALVYSGATFLAGMLVTIVCVARWSMIPPALLGHMLGTYLAMRWHGRKRQ